MHTHKLSQIYRVDVHTLAVAIWTLGLIIGIYGGIFVSAPLSAAIDNACLTKNSLFVPAAVLPITLVYLASKCSMQGLIYPILFVKAMLDGVILLSVGRCFGSAAWLMGIPVLLADRISTVFLLHYSIRSLTDRHYRIHFWYFTILLLTICAILLDRYFISGIFIPG